MPVASSELRAHGSLEASLKTADLAVAWYKARPASEPVSYKKEFLWVLRQSERWAEAKALAEAILAKNLDDIGLRGTIGALAARMADAVQARRIEAEFAALMRPYLYGRHTYRRAWIAAQLGEKERSVVLLRNAFAQGCDFNICIPRDLPSRRCGATSTSWSGWGRMVERDEACWTPRSLRDRRPDRNGRDGRGASTEWPCARTYGLNIQVVQPSGIGSLVRLGRDRPARPSGAYVVSGEPAILL